MVSILMGAGASNKAQQLAWLWANKTDDDSATFRSFKFVTIVVALLRAIRPEANPGKQVLVHICPCP